MMTTVMTQPRLIRIAIVHRRIHLLSRCSLAASTLNLRRSVIHSIMPVLKLNAAHKPVSKTAVRQNAKSSQTKRAPGAGPVAVVASQLLAVRAAFADLDVTTFVPPTDVPETASVPAATEAGEAGVSLFGDNPLLLVGIAGLVAVPVAITLITKIANGGSGGPGVKMTNPGKALEALEDARVVLVDIRSREEVKAQGKPDLSSVKRTAVSLPYTKLVKGEYEVDEQFGEKLLKLRGVGEESIVILIDADGSESKEAANLVEGVDKVYIVQGGAESWAATGPWKEPSKGLSLPNLKGLGSSLNTMAEDFKEAPSTNKAIIGLGAIAGAGLLLVNEAEVLVEIAGLAAAANLGLGLLLNGKSSGKAEKAEVKEIVDSAIAAAVVEDSDGEQGEEAPAAQGFFEAAAATEAEKPAEDAKETKAENAKEAAEW